MICRIIDIVYEYWTIISKIIDIHYVVEFNSSESGLTWLSNITNQGIVYIIIYQIYLSLLPSTSCLVCFCCSYTHMDGTNMYNNYQKFDCIFYSERECLESHIIIILDMIFSTSHIYFNQEERHSLTVHFYPLCLQ
jgi:hypothetical protein